jgi:TonB family protein
MARVVRQAGARVNVVGMAMPGAFLPQRIRQILGGRTAQRISRVRMVCVAIACAVVSTVFTAGAMDHAQAPANTPAVTSSNPQDRSLTVAALSGAAALPPQAPPHKTPRVLLAQVQTTQVQIAQVAANSTPQSGGSISGSVEDPSGARVPGCTITVRNQSGASLGSAVSNAAGLYQVTSLPPGHYNLEYLKPGFARRRMTVEIEAGKPLRIDAKLELGQVSEVVTVTAPKPAAPAPVAAQPAAGPGPISVGGRVESARLLRNPQPVYPPELQQQGFEATVRIRAVISRDGAIVEARVLNTDEVDPRFAQAAMDAVSQWRYQPATLNEHPVGTLTTIDVNFQLGK